MTESKQQLLSALNEKFSLFEPDEHAKRVFEKINFSQFSEEQIRDFGDLFLYCMSMAMDYFNKQAQENIPIELEQTREINKLLLKVNNQQTAGILEAVTCIAELRVNNKGLSKELEAADIILKRTYRQNDMFDKWATVPDCIRWAKEAAAAERKDGKNTPAPKQSDTTLRQLIQGELNSRKGQRKKTTTLGDFFPIVDIAEIMERHYKAFPMAAYITEFQRYASNSDDLHRAPR